MSRRRRSRATPEPSDDQLRLIKQQGWTLTAESYIRAMFHPDLPTFPLDDDVLASVPDDLPDNVPFTLEELLATSNGEPDLLADNPDDHRDLPEAPDIQDEHDWAVMQHEKKHGPGRIPDSMPPSPDPPGVGRVSPAIVDSGLRCPVCRHVLAHLEPRSTRSMRMARCPSCRTRWSSEGAH